ncbi:MAG: SGNH/GDSL hydrolase family protein, partial [Lentisphaeria bacterium]|nr:SGNH/GDSL hydrolase family protein [Lentisphaeria bacterium]
MKKADPDLIVIMLGHNDTMTRSNDNFTTAQVPVSRQLPLALDVLRQLRSRFPSARVLLVSPLALDGQFLKNKLARRLAAGAKNLYWFGSPEMLAKFTANWKKAADEAGVEFLDIYTPMSAISDRIKFFKKGDEVHLNAAGHVWLTGKLLDWLSTAPDWKEVKKYTLSGTFTFKAPELSGGSLKRGSGTMTVSGKRKITSAGALEMDGRSTALSLSGVAVPESRTGFTLDLVCKSGRPAGNNAVSLAYDGLFYAGNSFVLARYQRSFYMLWFDGKKYQKAFLSPAFFDLKNPRTHHIAMTCKYHEAVDQGEIWTEVQIYVDGKAVVSQKLPKVQLPAPAGGFEFAGSSRFGIPWNFGGEVYGGGYFNCILTEKEIRDRVLEFKKVVTPAFKQAAQIPADMQKKILAAKLSKAQSSACFNLARSGFRDMDKILKDPQKYLLSLGKKKILTLVTYPGKVRIVSLYDEKNQRELFNWNNPLFELHFQRGNQKKSLAMADLENNFAAPPRTVDGV